MEMTVGTKHEVSVVVTEDVTAAKMKSGSLQVLADRKSVV